MIEFFLVCMKPLFQPCVRSVPTAAQHKPKAHGNSQPNGSLLSNRQSRPATLGNPGQRPLPPISRETLHSHFTLYPHMPRGKRIVVPGLPHHITQRGNGRAKVFDCDQDRVVFLDLLANYASQYGLSLWGYCLMSNHFHLIAVPAHEGATAKVLGRLVSTPSPWSRRTAGGRWPTSNATLFARAWARPQRTIVLWQHGVRGRCPGFSFLTVGRVRRAFLAEGEVFAD
jgi:REP element-mobilizing transposase RayT